MRILTLSEISQLEPGEVVPAFKAQVKETKPIKRGNNQYGDYTIQTLTLMDATGISQVKLFDCPEYTGQWVGVWIYVQSSLNDKGKLSGIQVSTYRDKKEIHVKGNAGASIAQATSEALTPEPTRQAPPPAQQAPPPAAISPTTPQQAPAPSPRAPAPEPPAQARQPAPAKPQTTTEEVRRAIADCKTKLGQLA